MIDLTEHEKKIFDLIKKNPEILTSKESRTNVANEIGMSEKTLRNRIGDLRRYGLLSERGSGKEKSERIVESEKSEGIVESPLSQNFYLFVWALASVASFAIFIVFPV
tara:strand:- start:8351 stop:8674 length:324 start_codon:yes stop_codon:yes gene_type:complete